MATPPDFSVGQVLTGTQMNQVGLWLVKTETIGTTVSSVAVTGAFSADFESYKILVIGGSGSTSSTLGLQMGSTTTGYFGAYTATTFAGGASLTGLNNGASFIPAGAFKADSLYMNAEVTAPFLTKNTQCISTFSTGARAGSFAGYLDNTTSYTGFTITLGAGTVTGGTIYVYGYNS